jgi:hypothetical protein
MKDFENGRNLLIVTTRHENIQTGMLPHSSIGDGRMAQITPDVASDPSTVFYFRFRMYIEALAIWRLSFTTVRKYPCCVLATQLIRWYFWSGNPLIIMVESCRVQKLTSGLNVGYAA